MADEQDLDAVEDSPDAAGDSLHSHGFALGLILGAVLGAGLALLVAPARGSRTRRKLKRRFRRGRPGLRERIELAAERARERVF
jgi:gas vesicle protein